MTVQVYSSSDSGAPTLNASAGSLISLLDACLVNGYGSISSAGWTKTFSGTDAAVYKQASGNQFYLSVNHSNATYATVAGYENATSLTTGTGMFPLIQQQTTGYWVVSGSSSYTSIPWFVIATGKSFYLWMDVNKDNANATLYFFGDITSYKSSDAFHTMLICQEVSGTYSNDITTFNSSLSNYNIGHFIARSFTQIGTSIRCNKVTDTAACSSVSGRGWIPYPNPVDNSLTVFPIWIVEYVASNAQYPVRGILPGLWAVSHTLPLSSGSTCSGMTSGPLNGKTFMALSVTVYNTPNVRGQFLIETSNTW